MSEKRAHRTTVVSRAQEEQPAANARQALGALEGLLTTARGRLRDRVIESGRASMAKATDPNRGPSTRGAEAAIVGVSPVATPRISSVLFEQRQVAVHALARLSVEVDVARELLAWSERRADRVARRLGEAAVAEALTTVRHGVLLSPGELIALIELDLGDDELEKTIGKSALVGWARTAGGSDALQNLAESSLDGDGAPAPGRDDDGPTEKRRTKLGDAGVTAAKASSIRAALAAWGSAGAFELQSGKKSEGAWAAAATALEEIGRLTPAIGGVAIDTFAATTLLRAHGSLSQSAEQLQPLARGKSASVIALAEPGVPGVGAPRTCAEATDDGGFALFGDKSARRVFHEAPDPEARSGADAAEVLIVLARTDMSRAGSAGSSLLVAPLAKGAPGVTVDADGALVFDGFTIGPAGVLGGEPGHAAGQLDTALAAGWFGTAAVRVGIAQGALEIAAAAARERLAGSAPLLRRPRVASRIGRVILAVAGARRVVAAAARTADPAERLGAAASARLASARAAAAAIALAEDFGSLLGRRPTALLTTLAAAARSESAYGSEDDAAEALARRLLA